MFIAAFTNDDILKISAAVAGRGHPALLAVVEKARAAPRFDPADQDLIEEFDVALDLAEGGT